MTKKNAIEGAAEIVPVKDMAADYLRKNIVNDFSQYTVEQKLALFTLRTPRSWIGTKKVGGKMVKFVPYQNPRKVLNFIFNFNVSTEILREEYISYKEKFKDYETGKETEKTVTEAEATVKFTFHRPDGYDIIRTVKSSHKGVFNKATTRGDLMKSAVSKAWTLAAQSFGICADLDKDGENVGNTKEDLETATTKKAYEEEKIGY